MYSLILNSFNLCSSIRSTHTTRKSSESAVDVAFMLDAPPGH